MQFSSDNWAGAHPKIMERLVRISSTSGSAYGTSELDHAVEARFSEIFEKDVSVFLVGTGTAANCLAMAAANRAGGIAFCHSGAHLLEDEGNAPGFFTQGARLYPVDGANGKIDPNTLKTAIDRFEPVSVHGGRPMAVSLTQASEAGTVYKLEEIAALSAIARQAHIPLHMDGARFANALAVLGCSAAEMSWQQGVDLLSFGATKNGCWCAEALIVFNPDLAAEMPFLRKRSGQLFSKSRFIAAQFDAYLQNGLWLDLAAHANQMANAMRRTIEKSQNLRLAWPTVCNEVFCIVPTSTAGRLRQAGVSFHDWHPPVEIASAMNDGEICIRLVTSFATSQNDIDEFGKYLEEAEK